MPLTHSRAGEVLYCDLGQSEIISSGFKWDLRYEVSADLHEKFKYGYQCEEKKTDITEWEDSTEQSIAEELIS